jgi:hypothetical protein
VADDAVGRPVDMVAWDFGDTLVDDYLLPRFR